MSLLRTVRPPPCTRLGRRTLFNLPDLSAFSPFPTPNASESPDGLQRYHESRILPYALACSVPSPHPPSMTVPYRYSRRQLYDLVSDVASYRSFIPFCTHSRILSPPRPLPTSRSTNDATRVPMQMEGELTVAFLSFQESYVSTVTCRPFESVEVRFLFVVPPDLLPMLLR